MSSALATSMASNFVPVSSSASMNLDSLKQQEDVALKAYVANICFKCYICMLQVFHVDVASVLFQTFQLFETYVTSVLSGCCICFSVCCKCFI
jgi:hypothetical protein